jgi:Putative lumazine-binding
MSTADSGMALDEVRDLLDLYFDGLYRGDAGLLATVFHPAAVYATATEGTLTRLSMPEYLPIVAGRKSPASQGEARTDTIESIAFAGPVTALARVRCSIGPRRFTDLLSLVRVDGRWQIVAKVFHFDLDPAGSEERAPGRALPG